MTDLAQPDAVTCSRYSRSASLGQIAGTQLQQGMTSLCCPCTIQ